MNVTLGSTVLTLALAVGLAAPGRSGQQAGDHSNAAIGRRGVLHTRGSVRAGDVILPPGMYVVQHVGAAQGHIVVFTQLSMDGAAQKYVFMPRALDPGITMAKVPCRVESVGRRWGRTKLVLREDAAGEKQVVEVHIRGEALRHVL